MKFLTVFFLSVLSLSSFATQGINLTIKKNTVLTQGRTGFLAMGQSHGYDCRLDLELARPHVHGEEFRDGNWNRLKLTDDLTFTQVSHLTDIVKTEDHLSECLEYSQPEWDNGWSKTCLKRARQYQTRRSILRLENPQLGISGDLACEERFSIEDLEFEEFMNIVSNLRGNFPLFLELK